MNRKLKNCLAAASASGLLLVAALLAGSPVEPARPASSPLAATSSEADGHGSSRPRTDRRGLALPYFSFARGTRRIGG